jgi:hypothetical protein
MSSFARPGTYAVEVLSSQQVVGDLNGSSIAAFLGVNGRGPTQVVGASTVGKPTLCSNWSDFLVNFGGFGVTPSFTTSAPTLPYAVFSFFANGGQSCYVERVISGTGAVLATRTLTDRAGSPQSTLAITAQNEGAWGNNIFIDITDGATNRFNLIVHSGDATASTIVERWLDLSMTATDARYAPNVINPSPSGALGSDFIKVSDAGSSSTGGTRNPSVQAGTSLASGADGTAPANADYAASLSTLDVVDQPMLLNIDATDSTNLGSAITYASGRGDVFVIVDPAPGLTVSGALSAVSALTNTGYAAMYFPRIAVIDPATSTQGVTKTIAPGGAIAGLIQRIDTTRGVWKAPAGLSAKLLTAVGVERVLTNPELDTLNTNISPINAIRAIPGSGIVCMGARTLTTTTIDKYVPNRRTLIYLKSVMRQLTQFAVFEPNNQLLWDQITSILTSYLTSFWQSGGLAGATPLTAFYVTCDSTTNTAATVQAGEVHAQIGVALNYPAEYIVLQIGQTAAGGSVTEVQ